MRTITIVSIRSNRDERHIMEIFIYEFNFKTLQNRENGDTYQCTNGAIENHTSGRYGKPDKNWVEKEEEQKIYGPQIICGELWYS